MDLYGHVTPSLQADAAERLDEALRRPRETQDPIRKRALRGANVTHT